MPFDFLDLLLFGFSVLVFFVVVEVGFRLGCRHRERGADAERTHITALQSALLGLLSLLLSFTFAMAGSRFEARRSLLQEEVAAIETVYYRSELLPDSLQQEIKAHLREYVAARIELMRAGIDPEKTEEAETHSKQAAGKIWGLIKGAVAANPSGPVTALFLPSFTEMVHVNEKRREALGNHVPSLVVVVLTTVAKVALGFIAFNAGLSGKRRSASTLIFALVIALVLTTILDMDQPRDGFIRVSEDSLVRLQDTLKPSP